MDCPFAIEDVFAAGIGCDIAAAWFLARGFIATPEQIKHAGTTTYSGNPENWARGVRDRVDATFGIRWLAIGFCVQVIGYALILGFASDPDASVLRAAVAVACALLAGAVVLLVERLTYRTRVRHAAVALARLERVEDGYVTQPYPSGEMLRILGERLLEEPPRENESDDHYASRIWEINPVSDHSAY